MTDPNSFILKATTRVLFFIINLFAIYLLLRGHNLPGGGFIAGLASAIALVLLGLAHGVQHIEGWIRIDPMRLAAYGMLLAILTALLPFLPFFPGTLFFEHTMFHLDVPLLGALHVGTTLTFDMGVYLVVVGVTGKVVISLTRSTSGEPALSPAQTVFYASVVEQPVEAGKDPKEEVPSGS